MSTTNVAFFSLLGASLKLPALVGTLWLALLVAAVRLAAIAAGAWAGCTLGHTSAEHCRLFWLSMVTQAGVAMGLARIAATRFPTWGPNFQTLVFSIVMINMLVGPPLFRAALIMAGEARTPKAKQRSSESSAAAAGAELAIHVAEGAASPAEKQALA